MNKIALKYEDLIHEIKIRDIGSHIKEVRMFKKITQLDLSRYADVGYDTLRKVENGQIKNPSMKFVCNVYNALDLDIGMIILRMNTAGEFQ